MHTLKTLTAVTTVVAALACSSVARADWIPISRDGSALAWSAVIVNHDGSRDVRVHLNIPTVWVGYATLRFNCLYPDNYIVVIPGEQLTLMPVVRGSASESARSLACGARS